jgi:hypothetical protein
VGLLVIGELKKFAEKKCRGLMAMLSNTCCQKLKKTNDSQDKLRSSRYWNQVLLNHNAIDYYGHSNHFASAESVSLHLLHTEERKEDGHIGKKIPGCGK